jgi:hypothetical protein
MGARPQKYTKGLAKHSTAQHSTISSQLLIYCIRIGYFLNKPVRLVTRIGINSGFLFRFVCFPCSQAKFEKDVFLNTV